MRGSPVALGVILLLVLALSSPAASITTSVGTKELKLHELVNEARATAGLGALSLRDRLSRRAERHSRRMAERGVLFHSDLGGLGGSAGEVVGYGPSVSAVLTQFMASAAHRDILLGGWQKTGIGVARGAGWTWVTQIVKG